MVFTKSNNTGKFSRNKGKVGERELAKTLRSYGYDTKRGQQFCGLQGNADVVGVPGLHIECKRVERLNLENAMQQSIRDSRENEIPVVIHRKNYGQWLVTIPLEAFMKIYNEYTK